MVSNYQEHVREHSGRLFSKHELYHLPADEEEFNRLGGQHRALTMTMGLFYDVSDLVKSILSTGSETPLAVVDIGTGSGHWALELATEFPHVSVLGVDIVPPNPKCEVPSNCSFEIYDVNLPLGKYSDKFNLCHLRSVAAGIKDNEAFLYRIPQVLKPNGVLLLASGDIRLYAEDETPFPVDVDEDHPQWCASQAIIWESYKMKRRHDDPEEMKYRWERLLAENPFIESCGGGDTYIPIGPWKNGEY
ncbi:hypothetical protein FRC03_006276 [Tulasnella sp. 419]|nr:hypothetical protein FRC03_006276 [Tulasnella sp. 419]